MPGIRTLISLLLLLALVTGGQAEESLPKPPKHPYVQLETTEGRIVMELLGEAAPFTVAHFLELVDSGYYDGLVFHRVIPEFMIQGGGYTPGLELKEGDGFIPNESGNGHSNRFATVAMARTNDPHSANAQFFINVADNSRLDPGNQRWGYTVFGFVIEGMDVAERISKVQTGPQGPLKQDVPQVPVVIKKASRFTFE